MVVVRCNKRQSPRDPESWEWFFLFSADRKGRIPPVKRKYLDLFDMVNDEEGVIIKGQSRGVVYELITFDSRSNVQLRDLRKLVPEFIWDSHLYHGQTRDRLERYVAKCLEE